MKHDVENTNKGGIYEKSASASPGNYTFSQKYLGDTDDYYDPPTLHGESFATLLTFSVPPEVIRAGETVSLSFSLVFTDTNLSAFHGTGSARADWDNLRFTNADGKNVFEIFYSVYYSEKNVLSISDTVSAVIPPRIFRRRPRRALDRRLYRHRLCIRMAADSLDRSINFYCMLCIKKAGFYMIQQILTEINGRLSALGIPAQ